MPLPFTTCQWPSYNAVFPSFYPKMFPTRTQRSGMAISQSPGTRVTALLPTLFVAVAPPGATDIPLMSGATTLGVATIAAIVAWTARETYRTAMNDLGNRCAAPLSVPEVENARLREHALRNGRMRGASV